MLNTQKSHKASGIRIQTYFMDVCRFDIGYYIIISSSQVKGIGINSECNTVLSTTVLKHYGLNQYLYELKQG